MSKQDRAITMNTYDAAWATGFDGTQKPYQAFDSSAVADNVEQRKRWALSNLEPHPVALPPNLFTPEDSQSLDLRSIVPVPAGTGATLFRFVGPKGMITIFLSYVLAHDVAGAVGYLPFINGNRVLQFHGNPLNNFAFDSAFVGDPYLAPGIPCQLQLQPNDVLTWTFSNNSLVTMNASVRMQGYVSGSIVRKQGRFGG